MKHLFITGLALVLSGSAALAQYADDPYPNSGSENVNRSTRYEADQRYNQDNYTNDSYNDEYGDGYIDYDDDSYTTRFRRFNDVYAGYNYWSPVYSPYWAMPVYMDPWYYSPYRMSGWGISLGWSWGNPYWNSGWGMSNWWGYNGFNYWNRPYGWGGGFGYGGWGYGGYGGYGYGWGYGNGLDYSNNRRGVNYGPRRNYGSVVGGSRASNGIRPNPGTVGSGRDNYRRRGDLQGNPNVRPGRNTTGQEVRNGYTRDRVPGNNNGIRINEGSRRTREINNRNFDRSPQPGRNYQSERPNTVAPRETTRPSRNYERSSPAPSRSYSSPAPAPSRSSNFNSGGGSRGGGFGGGSGGGGSRGGGGYRR
ncbi:MAG: hypothetical protein EOP54_02780 [Sphingobacteriales bacterium]|nr:MAG: hypothetical protein EOP54_02780 [Sphingobacteriales bacterium]